MMFFSVAGHVRSEILEPIARMPATSQEANPGDRNGCSTDRGNRNLPGIQLLQLRFKLALDGHRFPPIASRHDEHGNVIGIYVRDPARRHNPKAAHRYDRLATESHCLDPIGTVTSQFRERVGRLPISKSVDYQEVHCFVRHVYVMISDAD